MEITIKTSKMELSCQLDDDYRIDEFYDAIYGMLVSAGWHPQTIAETFAEISVDRQNSFK